MAAARLSACRAIAHLFDQAQRAIMGNPMNGTAIAFLFSLPLLPLAATAIAIPVVDTHVPSGELLSEIEGIVRNEFYDRQGLAEFDAAEARLRAATASGESVTDASGDWLSTLHASHTGRF